MEYTITVFGLGFVGLTTALAFAEKGNKVYGYDINSERSKLIENGKLPFVEPGLDSALTKHINKNFTVVNNIEIAVKESDLYFYVLERHAKKMEKRIKIYIFCNRYDFIIFK